MEKHKLTPMYKYEHMRLVARQDHGFVRQEKNAKDYYLAGVSIEGPQSLSQRSTGREESNRDSQLDRNTMQETRRVKREVTITAGVLRPRYLRTYARLAPVNRAKEARLRLDRNHRFDEGASRRLTNEPGGGRRKKVDQCLIEIKCRRSDGRCGLKWNVVLKFFVWRLSLAR